MLGFVSEEVMAMIPAVAAFPSLEAAEGPHGCRREASRRSKTRLHKLVHRVLGLVVVFAVSLVLHVFGLFVAEQAYAPYRIGGIDDPVRVSVLARTEARRPPASELDSSFARTGD